MATQVYDWTEIAGRKMTGTSGLLLWVEDGTLGHCTALATATDLPAALADYAAGYDAGDEPHPVTVRWTLYQDGEAVDCGSHTWDYPIR